MPPADNNTPAAPTPQEPKKGFFAKLFGLGKKKDNTAPVVPPLHESQTPPPQLDDTQDPASPGEGAVQSVVSEPPVDSVAPEVSVENTSVVSDTNVSPGVEVPQPVDVSSTSEVVAGDEEKSSTGPVPPAQ